MSPVGIADLKSLGAPFDPADNVIDIDDCAGQWQRRDRQYAHNMRRQWVKSAREDGVLSEEQLRIFERLEHFGLAHREERDGQVLLGFTENHPTTRWLVQWLKRNTPHGFSAKPARTIH